MSQRKKDQLQRKRLLQPISGNYISKNKKSIDDRLFTFKNLMKSQESQRLMNNKNYQSSYKYGGKVTKGYEVSIYDERIKYIINKKDQIVLNKNLQRALSIQPSALKRKSNKSINGFESKSNIQKVKRTSSTIVPSIKANNNAIKAIPSLDCQGLKYTFKQRE